MTASEMKDAALATLGQDRISELAVFPALRNNTSTTMSQSEEDSQNVNTLTMEVPDVEQGIEDRA